MINEFEIILILYLINNKGTATEHGNLKEVFLVFLIQLVNER